MPQYPGFSVEMGSHVSTGWPQTMIFLISASQVDNFNYLVGHWDLAFCLFVLKQSLEMQLRLAWNSMILLSQLLK
jgi:hypothetical protein